MIKNLLFDLGGVIMDIEKERCIDAFQQLGLKDAASFFGDFGQKGPFMLIEEGRITPEEFHAAIREMMPVKVSDKEMDNAFIRFLIGIPVERLRLLESLRRRYKIFLLSNTNPIMWNSFIASEFRKDGHDINYYFDGVVTSFEAKALKPDAKIYQYTIEKLDIRPDETIFFDDSQKNLDAACLQQFKTCLVAPDTDICTLIPQLLPQ